MIEISPQIIQLRREVSKTQYPALSQLTSHGIVIGVSHSASRDQTHTFPLSEVNLRSESLALEASSRFMATSAQAHVIWNVIIDEFHLQETFASKKWDTFLSLFLEEHAATHTLVLYYPWGVRYASDLLESIDALQMRSPLPVLVNAEHYTWKTPEVQKAMHSLKLQHVYMDAPHLPGLIKKSEYHTGRIAILRCTGRNAKSWFEPNLEERYCYSYSQPELCAIADRIIELRDDHKKVYVTLCNRPASATVANAIQLADELQKRM